MRCPKCALFNPPSAVRCDCATVEKSYVANRKTTGTPALAFVGIGIIALSIIITVAMNSLLFTRFGLVVGVGCIATAVVRAIKS
jgi:hypothetical protein